ncbi:acyltransferase [Leucobacter sp. NPDC015123]|uniref:acyltransferase family protein n=1 Tax=Leucobacter sp. NPDC015123 TaxID=3364129 RepID=UPI0036F45A7C
MSLISIPPAPTAPSPGRDPEGDGTARDSAVDLIRAACLLAVVAVHALMVGVSVQGGEVVLENALESWGGFTVFSWFTQMMPLFFIAGGFASAAHYRRLRAQGVTPSGYVTARLGRLLPVPLLAAMATTCVLAGLSAAGVSPEIVAAAGWRISQPLWFLGVYVLCSALVPAMLALHERAPRLTLAALGVCVMLVDLTRHTTGVDAIGFVNLGFVWLFVQQLGFLLADGVIVGPRTAVAALAGGALWIAIGASPMNLFEALNPPTAALAFLGVIQLAVFTAVRPALARLATLPTISWGAAALNGRAMTIYSWHMPATVLLAGALLVTAHLGGDAEAALSRPLSADWWLSRPVWLVAVAIVVACSVAAATRLERRILPGLRFIARPAAARTTLAVLSGAGGVLVILAATGSLTAWLSGAALLAAAIVICLERRQKANAVPSSRP